MPINQTQKLQAKLHKLQINCPLALAKKQSSNFRLYQLLTASYLWWREAKQIEGYLDSLYATKEIQFKTNIKSGINFNPLLKLTFGIDTISSKIADKYSKALNTVHNEFERKPALYKKDGVTKLATFIQNNGGTTELAVGRQGAIKTFTKHYLRFVTPAVKIQNIDPKLFRTYLAFRRKSKSDILVTVVINESIVIKQLYQFAIDQGMLKADYKIDFGVMKKQQDEAGLELLNHFRDYYFPIKCLFGLRL